MLDKMRFHYEMAKAFVTDERAQAGASGEAVQVIVGLVVGGLMAAFLLPIVINELVSVETTAWSEGASALWNILPVMIVLAVFIFFAGLAIDRAGY